MAHTGVGLRAVVVVNARSSRIRDPETVLTAFLAATAALGSTWMGSSPTGTTCATRSTLPTAAGSCWSAATAACTSPSTRRPARSRSARPDGPRQQHRPLARAATRRAARGARRGDRARAPGGRSARRDADAKPVWDRGRQRGPPGRRAHALRRARLQPPPRRRERVWGALAAYEPRHLELELDGQPAYEGDAAGLFLSNFPLFAYGFKIDPRADIADGRFAAVVLEADSRHRVVRLVLAAYRGTLLGRRNVTVAPAREAVITTPVPMVCDSEVLGHDDRVGAGGAGQASIAS